jgi:hypothetical protein
VSTFPIILVPRSLEIVKQELPPVPNPPVLSIPKKPGSAPTKVNKKLLATEGTIGVIPTGILVSKGDAVSGLMLLLATATAITAQAWMQIRNYPQRTRNHQKLVISYQRDLTINNAKEQEYIQQVKKARTPDKVAKYRKEKIQRLLLETQRTDTTSDARKGRSEPSFQEYLKRYFPNKIETQKGFNIPNYQYPYTPDFIYVDSSLNLYIDIEIDEPYFLNKSGQFEPYHYLYSKKDKDRNQFFLEKNWIVIRFAEEQVVHQPESCCRVIAETIAELLKDDSILYRFDNISPLNPIEIWTEAEASKMADSQYRDQYLDKSTLFTLNEEDLIYVKPVSPESIRERISQSLKNLIAAKAAQEQEEIHNRLKDKIIAKAAEVKTGSKSLDKHLNDLQALPINSDEYYILKEALMLKAKQNKNEKASGKIAKFISSIENNEDLF